MIFPPAAGLGRKRLNVRPAGERDKPGGIGGGEGAHWEKGYVPPNIFASVESY